MGENVKISVDADGKITGWIYKGNWTREELEEIRRHSFDRIIFWEPDVTSSHPADRPDVSTP